MAVALSVVGLLAWSTPAAANGRFPAAGQLVVSPTDPDLLVLRATYGILISKDRGRNWDWICETAVGYGGVEDPAMGVMGRGTILAGTFQGLSISPDDGCAWGFVGGELDGHVFIDVVVRPNAPREAFALTSSYAGGFDGGSTYTNDFFATKDEGATWQRVGTGLPRDALSETLEVARSDAARLYATAATAESGQKQGRFFVSTDTGQTFVEHPIELFEGERAPFVSGVDPTNADRVYVRTSAFERARLLVSDDGGQTFRTVFEGPPLLGFALSEDGSKVYVGNTDGLFVATREALAFEKRSGIVVQCLTVNGDTLYACSDEPSGFVLGTSHDEGATFEPLLHLATLRGPLACAEGSRTADCADEWPATRDLLGIDTSADAGADAGAPPVLLEGNGGCACSLTSPTITEKKILAGTVAFASFFALAWRRARRHARRHRR